MKKYFFPIIAPFILVSGKVMAQSYDLNQVAGDMAEDSPIKNVDNIYEILRRVVQYAYTLFFILAVLFILIAAFNFLTAKGDSAKVQSARSQITWAAVAIVIALISVGAAEIIKSFISTP